jgi:hypothetical protein
VLTLKDYSGDTQTDTLQVDADGGATGIKVWANDILIKDETYDSFFSVNYIPVLSDYLRECGLPDGEYKLTAKTRNNIGYWGAAGGDFYYTLTDLYKVTLDENGVAEYSVIKDGVRIADRCTFTLFKFAKKEDYYERVKVAEHLVEGTRCDLSEYISGGLYYVTCLIRLNEKYYINTTYESNIVSFNKSLIGNNLFENVYIDNNPARLLSPFAGASYTLLFEGREIGPVTAKEGDYLTFIEYLDDNTRLYFNYMPGVGWYFPNGLSDIKSGIVSVRIDSGQETKPLIDTTTVRPKLSSVDGRYIAEMIGKPLCNEPFSYYFILKSRTDKIRAEIFTKETKIDFTDIITEYNDRDWYFYAYAYLDRDPTKYYYCGFSFLYV